MSDPLPEAPQIMIVEDSPETRQLLLKVLNQRGFSARAVGSGELALRTALQTPPDLILLDIDLPDMNGYEVCERLKANDRLRPIPVIFISGLDGELDKVQRHYAETLRKSGESLLTLLNDILDISKIEAGKLDLESIDFDLRILIEDVCAMQAPRVQGKGLELICDVAPDVPIYLQGDPGRLRQTLVNLVGNAVKFTKRGEIAVRASLAVETEDGVMVRFSIKDTGIGFTAEKRNLLFQKFTQLDSSTSRHYGGTGLGLFISKQLAEMMGGEIGVESVEGQGSEFWFTAKFTKQPAKERQVTLTTGVRGAHILVVDDNATNREILMAQLNSWSVLAEEAADGPAALQALRRARDVGNPFKVAIVDMQMPGMDGASLALAIKDDDTLKATRLMLMTSMGQRGEARQFRDIGFAAYLVKPTRQSDLLDSLSLLLDETSKAQSTQPLITRHRVREMRDMRLREIRILLAEDNTTNQEVALAFLNKMGLQADVVQSGVEAINALEAYPYDIVLMDVQMPEMDGLEATRQIRRPGSTVQNPKIPIIAMTANAMTGDQEMCLAAGMNDYIAKPISLETLRKVLEKYVTSAPAADQHASLQIAPTFDREAMQRRLSNDLELERKIIEVFLRDAPKNLAELQKFLDAGDVTGAERIAHSLKSTAAMVGGERMAAASLAMEKEAHEGRLDFLKAHVSELNEFFDQLQQAIKEVPDYGLK